MAEVQRQKWYYNQKIGAIGLKSGNLVLVKADAFQGKRKIMDRWEDKLHEVVHQITTDIPLYKVKDQQANSCVLYCNQLLLMASNAGIPLCMGVCQVQDRCISPTPVKPTPRGSDSKTMLQEDDGLVITQHQTRKNSLGCTNGSYGFSCGCQLEHPLKMGEVPRPCEVDVDVFIDRMVDRTMCIWWRDRSQPMDTIA